MIVIRTKMRQIPSSCTKCAFYENMGGKGGRYNSGVCWAKGRPYSTENIKSSRKRLKNCHITVMNERGKKTMTVKELIQYLEECPMGNTVYINLVDNMLGDGYEVKDIIHIDVITAEETDTLTGVYLRGK